MADANRPKAVRVSWYDMFSTALTTVRDTVLYNYYYYFPPRAQQTVFLLMDNTPGNTSEVTFVTDDMNNSVYKE